MKLRKTLTTSALIASLSIAGLAAGLTGCCSTCQSDATTQEKCNHAECGGGECMMSAVTDKGNRHRPFAL